MDEAARVRIQIRAVLIVYRTELGRLKIWHPSGETSEEYLASLRTRCLDILDAARAELDGSAPWHPDLIAELGQARIEISAGN
jgi:hypothetical protein